MLASRSCIAYSRRAIADSPSIPYLELTTQQGLWLVEGTQYNNEGYEPPVPQWWGGNLEGAKQWPIKLQDPDACA